MEMNLVLHNNQYSQETVEQWQSFWSRLFDMCHYNTNIEDSLVALEGSIESDEDVYSQLEVYDKGNPINHEIITFDYTWKEYSKKAGPGFMPYKVPELKHLHVPECLFQTMGVKSFFAHSFPECVITFW